jgi:diguanylate cyclase (GGDEF)-like protein
MKTVRPADPGSDRRDVESELGDELEVEETRERARGSLAGRERWASVLVGGSFVPVAIALVVSVLRVGEPRWGLIAAYVAAYAIVSRVEFEVGQGSGVPTQLVFVPLLFALPPQLAPACVAAGLLLGSVPDLLDRRLHSARVFVLFSSSWHAVGPALVLWQLGPDTPRLSAWPVYLLALGSQFGLDFASVSSRHWLGRGAGPRSLVDGFFWVFVVDSLLAPVALLAALHARTELYLPLLLAPLVVLLRFFAADRRKRIDRSLALGRAYVDAHESARTDPLTGIRNRLAWDELLHDLSSSRAARPFTILLVDIDGLKSANDTRGHSFGDRVICATARVLGSALREDGLVARIGGDEFGILAPSTDARAAPELAARVRHAIAEHASLDGFRLSASIGYASSPPAETVSHALAAADAQMYETKVRAG